MTAATPREWDLVADVVVLGSGAAGLAAAVAARDAGAQVLLLEKTAMVGGTTAVSGGMPWIPMNRHMADVGVADSRHEALTYLRRLTLGREPDPALLEVYVDSAAEVMDHLETKTPLRMSAPPGFSDYYADLPGGKPEGRSVEPVPFDAAAALGEWAARLRTSPYLPWLTMEEGAKSVTGAHAPDLELQDSRRASDVRVLGASLVASLFKGLLDRDVEVLTGTSARELLFEGEVVAGMVVESGGSSLRVGARSGVVLACGGFEWDESMVKAFIGQRLLPMSPCGNEGDGHRMAMRAGAQLANMTAFWGQP
ncbi:MAG: FAD-dependent oxidoreductase, partial [Acidimicrobiales bacterium]